MWIFCAAESFLEIFATLRYARQGLTHTPLQGIHWPSQVQEIKSVLSNIKHILNQLMNKWNVISFHTSCVFTSDSLHLVTGTTLWFKCLRTEFEVGACSSIGSATFLSCARMCSTAHTLIIRHTFQGLLDSIPLRHRGDTLFSTLCGLWKPVISCCLRGYPLLPARWVNMLDTVEERNCNLITWGNCASWFACSPTKKGNLMYQCDKPTIPSSTSGITHLKVGCDVSHLCLKGADSQKTQCC